MGSRGTKRSRKGGRGNVRDQQRRERQAIADTMGFGGRPGWVRWTAILLAAALVLGAVVSLVALS